MIRWLTVIALSVCGFGTAHAADSYWVFIGTYTHDKTSKGIYRCELDPATGRLSEPELAVETANPSFLAIHPSNKFLYAVGEVSEFNGQKTGAVSAFALDPATGKLEKRNQRSSGGTGPCHLVCDREGRNVLVANYGGGNVAVLPIGKDGQLAEPSTVIQHEGKSVTPRQNKPYAHSINLDPTNRWACAADLGLDKVLVYKFDAEKGALTANDPPAGVVKPGSGPRHLAFHPTLPMAYVINEMANTVTAFAYDAEKGTLTEKQTISTLPTDAAKVQSFTAEVVVHPSGRFLYGSNRGHDSIAIFTIDAKTGELTAAGHQSEGIKTPRNFAIDPTGRWLIVGNQGGDTLSVFQIDGDRGQLKPTSTVKVAKPVCIRFVKKAS